jgi:hypothetical protein
MSEKIAYMLIQTIAFIALVITALIPICFRDKVPLHKLMIIFTLMMIILTGLNFLKILLIAADVGF